MPIGRKVKGLTVCFNKRVNFIAGGVDFRTQVNGCAECFCFPLISSHPNIFSAEAAGKVGCKIQGLPVSRKAWMSVGNAVYLEGKLYRVCPGKSPAVGRVNFAPLNLVAYI